MKRIKLAVLTLLAAGALTACGSSDTVELTTEQNNMIAEYIAGALLRYDMRYEEELIYASAAEVPPEETEPAEETPAPTETDTPDTAGEGENGGEDTASQTTYASLDSLIGESGVKLSYKTAAFYDSYPKDESDYFVIEPSVSNQLLVVEFTLKNETGKKKELDLSSAGIKYSLRTGGSEYKPLLTALPNDLRYLSTTLEADKSQNVVVIFEVGKDASLSDASLEISRGSQTAKIEPLK